MELIVLCIMPEDERIDEIRTDYSSKLNSKKTLHLPPHLTLVGRFYTRNYETFLQELKQICSEINRFTLDFNEINWFDDSKILFLKPLKIKELQQLHEDLLNLAAKFREPWTREALKINTDSQIQQEYIEKYGSPYVKEFYNPHISLAGPDMPDNITSIIGVLPKQISYKIEIKEITILRKVDEKWIVDKKIQLGE